MSPPPRAPGHRAGPGEPAVRPPDEPAVGPPDEPAAQPLVGPLVGRSESFEKHLGEAMRRVFPDGTAEEDLPEELRFLLAERLDGEGRRTEREQATFARLARGLHGYLRQQEDYERHQRRQIEDQLTGRGPDLAAGRGPDQERGAGGSGAGAAGDDHSQDAGG